MIHDELTKCRHSRACALDFSPWHRWHVNSFMSVPRKFNAPLEPVSPFRLHTGMLGFIVRGYGFDFPLGLSAFGQVVSRFL